MNKQSSTGLLKKDHTFRRLLEIIDFEPFIEPLIERMTLEKIYSFYPEKDVTEKLGITV